MGSEKGIQVQSMDSSHVALVSLLLRECAFSDFKCDRPASLGMNVESLSKVFKICGPQDSLKLKWQNDADTLNFQCESSEDDRIADFDLKLMQIESEHMEIPEQQYKVVARLPSGEFQKICRDLKEFGETMQMSASKEGIKFSVAGDVETSRGRKARGQSHAHSPRARHCYVRIAVLGEFRESSTIVWRRRTWLGA